MGLRRAFQAAWNELRGTHPRDPALADWFGGFTTPAGIAINPETSKRSPAVNSSATLLTETIATLPLDLFERGAGEGESRRATEHPLHDLVHNTPNPGMSSTDWRRRLMLGVLFRGNSYHRITWGGDGMVQRIDPLPKGGCFPFKADGRLWYRAGGETLKDSDVLHVRGAFQEGDELEARSPVVLNKELIATNIAAAEYLARTFQNSATPKIGIEIPGEVGAEAGEKLRNKFLARHTGLENVGKPVLLEMGMKFAKVAMTNSEAQVLETYRATGSEISSRVFGIPQHLSGDSDKQSNFGTGVEQADIGYAKHRIRPPCVGIEQALNMALLTAEGRRRYYFEFNIEGLLRGDFKSRMEGYALLIQWGVCTVNEIRRRENLPPIEGGDIRLSPLNYAPSDRLIDVLLKEPAAAKRSMDELRRDLAAALLRTGGDPA